LMFRSWSLDCNRPWRSLVIATDPEDVAVNARVLGGEVMETYQSTRRNIAHQEPGLVETFLAVVRQLYRDDVNVAFWRIPREWNNGRAVELASLASIHSF
jgi:ribonuclease HI